MSQWLVLALVMASACVVVLAITLLKHRRIADDDDPTETPDVIEYMTMMIGVVYAIVLGLAIAGGWEARSAAHENVRAEAQALHEVNERAQAYPAAVRDRIKKDIDAYVRYVVDEEWQVMADRGELSDRGTELFSRVRKDVAGYEPRTDQEDRAYQPMVDQVAVADDARGSRGDSAGGAMPGVVWFGLIVGALVTIGMIFTLQIRASPPELLLAGLFSALIAFLLFLIWEFDSPFSRDAGTAAGPFLDLFPAVDSAAP